MIPNGPGACPPIRLLPSRRGVAEDDYDKATVCTEFDVTQLADHLIGSVTYLCAVAGGEPGAGPVTSPLEARVATAAQAMLEAWHVRGLDGTVKVGPHAGLLERLIAFTGRTNTQ